MPSLSTIRSTISTLPSGPPLVVALVGGTTGIGSYTARALARAFSSQGHKLRVYLIGRNASRAAETLEYARVTCPGSQWEFVAVRDLSLMSEIDEFSDRIASLEREREANEGENGFGKARLDALWLSQALSPAQESPVTKEGLDTQMSLLYYSRIRLIQKLTPLLLAAPNPAHVISIYAGTMEGGAASGKPLPIGTPAPGKYGVSSVRHHTVFMKTFMFEELAERHAGKISFTHVLPGLVDGPTFYSDVNPLWTRILWRIMKPLITWYLTAPDVCGDVMVSLASAKYPAKGKGEGEVAFSSQNERGGGAYAVGQRGDWNGKVSYANVRANDTGKKVWGHTMGVFADIDKKNGST